MISTRQKYDMTMLRKCPSCGSNNLVYTQSGIDKYGMPEHHSIKCRDCEFSLHGSTCRFVFEKWNELDRTVDNLSKMFKSGQNIT